MTHEHQYQATITWTGNRGEGTRHYRAYDRSHTIAVEGKPAIAGSSDPAFRGDSEKHNPEEMLVASLSACHMLTYLHLAAEAGVIVIAYEDSAWGLMEERGIGGRFIYVVLKPIVTVAETSMIETSQRLHLQAHDNCFIASSVNFPVDCTPKSITAC